MAELKEINEVNINDEDYTENDFEKIVARLEVPLVAYMQVHDSKNFPFLSLKDRVALLKCDFYKVGDMVLYKQNDYFFLRRIIGFVENGCYVCGDAEREVRAIDPHLIIAKAISKEKGSKRSSLLIKKHNKAYLKLILRKGRRILKKRVIDDDDLILSNVYELATKAAPTSEEIKKEEKATKMELDSRLKAELAIFKSPETFLKEFENSNRFKA